MRTKERLSSDGEKIELRPDGWDRFRQAVHAAAKNGPMHRTKDAKPSIKKKRKR
jgi:hypothetical protein